MNELKQLTYYGDSDEAKYLFHLGCTFYRNLEGCPKTWRAQVLKMLKSMCKVSKKDLIEQGDYPETTTLKITGDRATV